MSIGDGKICRSMDDCTADLAAKEKSPPLLLLTTINYLFFRTIARKNKIRMASVIEEVTTEP